MIKHFSRHSMCVSWIRGKPNHPTQVASPFASPFRCVIQPPSNEQGEGCIIFLSPIQHLCLSLLFTKAGKTAGRRITQTVQ